MSVSSNSRQNTFSATLGELGPLRHNSRIDHSQPLSPRPRRGPQIAQPSPPSFRSAVCAILTSVSSLCRSAFLRDACELFVLNAA